MSTNEYLANPAKNILHKINLMENVKPSYIRNYRQSNEKESFINEQVEEWLQKGIICKSMSPWNSPLVVVPKGETFRLCMDFRKLNEITNFEKIPPPLFDEALDSLHGATVFSTIDLKNGYLQIELDPKSRELTAFTTHSGRFEFMRMPFGLINAPTTFQLYMETILREQIGKSVIVYLDDILIFSKTNEQHVKDCEWVLNKLLENNLVINFEKSTLNTKSISYLGFKIEEGLVKVDPDKTSKLKSTPELTTKKQVQSFLGLINFYRRFIPNMAKKAEPISKLLTMSNEDNIREAIPSAMNICKEICESKALIIPDLSKQFSISSDASDVAIGAHLFQGNPFEGTVAFASRLLTAPERNYSTIEKELLAIVFAIKKFKSYLFNEFTLFTDHKPLSWLNNIESPHGRLARWSNYISSFKIKIKYISGKENLVADSLSRNFINSVENISLIENKIQAAHIACGHGGIEATYSLLRKSFNAPGLFNQVKSFCSNCATCLKYTKIGTKYQIFPSNISGPFDSIGIDLVGPLPKSQSGMKFIIVATDYATRWVEARAIKYKTAGTIVKFLIEEIFIRHGPPRELRCDRGTEFINKAVMEITQIWNAKMKPSTPYHPQSNGLVERCNQTLVNKLRKISETNSSNWDIELQYTLFAYRISPLSIINVSPFELLYGRQPSIEFDYEKIENFDWHTGDINEYIKIRQDLNNKANTLINTSNKHKIEKIEKMNLNRSDSSDLKLGDQVLMKNQIPKNKLSPIWLGPFTVAEILLNGAYKISSPNNSSMLVNRSNLKIANSILEGRNVTE